ncbi:CxxC-x17-CxxC domain-containing protein [Thermoproteota archaeon]
MSERKMFKIKCSDCGRDAEVPFQPKEDSSIYCYDCARAYKKHRRH